MQNIKPLPTANELFGGKTRMLARYSDSKGWCAFNPSVLYTQDYGHLVLIRSSNGYLEDHREEFRTPLGEELTSQDTYMVPNEWMIQPTMTALWDGKRDYHNKMFLAKLDPRKLLLGTMHEVDLSESYAIAPVAMKRGLEDGRLYHDGTSLRISATAYETRQIPVARICNIKLNLPSLEKPFTTEFELFDSPRDKDTVEKNWMPVDKTFIAEGKTPNYDYIYDSGMVYYIKDRKAVDVGGHKLPLRGGSQVITLEDGTLLAITHQLMSHETMRFANITKSPLIRRRYAHRFVQYAPNGAILKVTDPFTFLGKSIEFASGLTEFEGKLLVSFGALDSSAHISSLVTSKVLSALREPFATTRK